MIRCGGPRVRGCVMVGIALSLSGCALKFSQRSSWDIQQLQALSEQLEQVRTLAQLNADEAQRLRDAKASLGQRLASEISSQDVSVGYDERGLVVRVLDHVLFDSGKAALRTDAHTVLDQVAQVLTQEGQHQAVTIEGHTDNQPIVHSHWKDNWELSLARARAVLAHLIQQGVEPSRVSATGFGEYRPVASNATAKGRKQNRRVEIVVLPTRPAKTRGSAEQKSAGPSSYTK